MSKKGDKCGENASNNKPYFSEWEVKDNMDPN